MKKESGILGQRSERNIEEENQYWCHWENNTKQKLEEHERIRKTVSERGKSWCRRWAYCQNKFKVGRRIRNKGRRGSKQYWP